MINDFIKKDNLTMLFETLIDFDFVHLKKIKGDNVREIQQVKTFFMENVKFFKDNVYSSQTYTNLVEVNKAFLSFMFRKEMFEFNKPPNINYEIPEITTPTNIKNQKLNEFEKEFQNKKKEFSNEIQIKIPPVPKFKDDLNNKPLENIDMDKIIYLRNKDIQDIYNNNQKKYINIEQPLPNNIIEENIIKLENTNPLSILKTVTWGENKYKEINNNEQNKYFEEERDDEEEEEEEKEKESKSEKYEENLKSYKGLSIFNKLKQVSEIKQNEKEKQDKDKDNIFFLLKNIEEKQDTMSKILDTICKHLNM
jgi:hypothetical protein